MTRIALVYPGQGSQTPGMGIPWKGTDSWKIAELAGEASGIDVPELLCTASAEELKDTKNSQLATLTLSLTALHYARRMRIFDNHTIVGHAGHSLGEYSALAASGAISWRDAIQLVAARGSAMRSAAHVEPGSMAAVGGVERTFMESLISGEQDCWMANDNGSGQFVISGRPGPVHRLTSRALKDGAPLASPLPVSGAFHCPLMSPASKPLEKALKSTTFRSSQTPVFTNVDARPHTQAESFPRLLLEQLVMPVRWRDIYTALACRSAMVIEIGPGKVLTRLGRRDHPALHRCSLNQPADIEKILDILSSTDEGVEN